MKRMQITISERTEALLQRAENELKAEFEASFVRPGWVIGEIFRRYYATVDAEKND
jgi:hypothetical protein